MAKKLADDNMAIQSVLGPDEMALAEPVNLWRQMEESFPEDLWLLLKMVAEMAAARAESLYLVGGAVRDLLLHRPIIDVDLVVEGDAPQLALRFAESASGQALVHRRFATAKLQWKHLSVDLVTARSETYERPGALPRVKEGSIQSDLFRRDFTINAMAVALDTRDPGQLVDPYAGRNDLDNRLIRVLHDKSFVDDATRIFRALRYEQRLGFRLEPETEKLLRRDVAMTNTVSGDRLRHELELVLQEERPETILQRMDQLGVLPDLHPALAGDAWLSQRFELARKPQPDTRPQLGLYLSLLVYRLTEEENENLIQRLKLRAREARTMRDTLQLKACLPVLTGPDLPASRLYRLLQRYRPHAIQAVALATDSPTVPQRLAHYLSTLRYVKSALTGKSLIGMGVSPGPRLGEMLNTLQDARLDGEVRTKEDEEALVRRWLAGINE